MLNFLRNCQFSKRLRSSVLPALCEGSSVARLSQRLAWSTFLILVIVKQVPCAVSVVLFYMSSTTNDVEHLFMSLICRLYIFLMMCLFNSFPPFLIRLFLYYWVFGFSLCILDVRLITYVTCKYFLPVCRLYFYSHNSFFPEEQILNILIKCNLSTFPLLNHAVGVLSR